MLKLVNDKELMGSFKNSTWMNVVGYLGAAILTALNIALIYNSLSTFFRS
jgi:Mn2+/Fe2+ NRAMP family transporter